MAQLKDRWQAIVRTVRENESPSQWNPATSAEIQRAEKALGFVFPRTYKWFLETFGFCFWPTMIYGLGDSLPEGFSIIHVTEQERHQVEPELPLPLIPFAPDGAGNHFCLDTAQMVKEECPVVFWDHEGEEDQERVPLYPTFLDWLEHEAAEEIAEEE